MATSSVVPSEQQAPCGWCPDRTGGASVILLENISWDTYERLARETENRQGVRLTYDRGRLQLMSPLPEHEGYAAQLGQFVRVAASESNLPLKCLGSMTIRRADLSRGLEPDNCFYLTSWPRIRGRKILDFNVDPPPDLALEIDITNFSLDRLPTYAALGIPEVWRFTGRELLGYSLMPDRSYGVADFSTHFPFLRLSNVTPFLLRAFDEDEATLTGDFRMWLRSVLPDR